MENNYHKISEDFREIRILSSSMSILSWDNSVMMPKNGIEYRSKQLSIISKLIHKSYHQKDYLNIINDIDSSKLNKWQQANLRIIKHHLIHELAIPEKLKQEFTENGINCEFIWRECKKENDFKGFLKEFKKVLANSREIAQVKSEKLQISKYDSCLDYYEEGLREADFKKIFLNLEAELPKLISKIIVNQPAKPDFSSLKFPIDKQKKLVKKFVKLLGLDQNSIRIDESSHPFCTGHIGDVRITTRYNESEFLTSLFGIIHESGHAIYDLNTPKAHKFDYVGSPLGMSIHESQSLFYEMQIARSLDFIKLAHKIIIEEFNIKNNNFTVKNLYNFLNNVEKIHIRVDSDEVTYPLHIIMRYHIEKQLINGEIEAENLPDIWEFYLNKFFNLKYHDHATGCLQDIHWTDGSFGYFPCYTLGAITASQLKAKFDQTHPNFEFSENNLKQYQDFLTDNVHKNASLLNASSLAQQLFGKKYDDNCFLNYLTKKYV